MQDRLSRLGSGDETKVIVKIYMNLQGVSQAFHRYGCVGSQARSIAPFTSAFSKCELYDIVDCGEKRECCEAKIKGMNSSGFGPGREATPLTANRELRPLR